MLLKTYYGVWAIFGFSTMASGLTVDDAENDPPLPADIPLETAVNSANILSASMPDSLFQVHDSKPFRGFSKGSQYTVSYSQDAITTSTGKTLYSIPVHTSDLRNLLQHANQFSRTQDVNAFLPSFRFSANGLTLIMNAIASTPGNPTFNWAAYADVAKILADNTKTTGNEVIGSWVGIVKNPSGAFVAEMGIIPELVVVPGTPKRSPPRKLKPRINKRDTYIIQGTSYKLVVTKGDITVPGQMLANLAKYVLDVVLFEPESHGYTALLTNDQGRDFWGPDAFSLIARGRVVLDHDEMLDIVRAIYSVVDTYTTRRTSAGRGRRTNVRNLRGQVLGSTGVVIAIWSIGAVPPPQLAAASVCPPVIVVQPDGSRALGCVLT